MSTSTLSQLSALYDVILEEKSLSHTLGTNESDLLLNKYLHRNESILHLSVLRKLFADSPIGQGKNSSNQSSSNKGVNNSKAEIVFFASRINLCKSMLRSNELFPVMIQYLASDEQLVSFTASKALVAVFANREFSADIDSTKLETALSDIFALVNTESLSNHRTIYCLQIFTEFLKNLRKPTFSEHPILFDVLRTVKTSWSRAVHTLSQSDCHSSMLPSSSVQTSVTSSKKGSEDKYGLILGEFLSLAVEALRYNELVLIKNSPFTLPLQDAVVLLRIEIAHSLCALTSIVNFCPSNSLYLLKRLLDVFLKLNSISVAIASCLSLVSVAHSHSLTKSPDTQRSTPNMSSPISTLQSESPPTLVTQPPYVAHYSASANNSSSSTEEKAHSSPITPSSNTTNKLTQTINQSLLHLLRNPFLISCFQFWMANFMKIAGLADDDLPNSIQSVEDALKCTVMRKACLLLFEHCALIVEEESKPRLTVQALLRLESFLQAVVNWATSSVPPTLMATLEGLLQDDVESTGIDFLRLLFYSLLTEQDDCLVRTLMASVKVHNALHKEYDSLTADAPLLHLSLGVFNVHTLFVKFLSGAVFDSTMLLDFVMSPETQFNHFLINYLDIVIREKQTSMVFNYDLQSACAELDIVEEYLSMDLSGSEDGGSGAEGDEEIDLLAPVHSVAHEAGVSGTALPARKRELDLCSQDMDGPAVKKVNFQESSNRSSALDMIPVSNACPHQHRTTTPGNQTSTDSLSRAALQNALHSTNSLQLDPARQSEPARGENDSKEIEVRGGGPSVEESLEDASVESLSENPPPTQTLVRVVNCLVKLGATLTRMCDKELLSRKVNNVGVVITQTEHIKQLYPEISFVD